MKKKLESIRRKIRSNVDNKSYHIISSSTEVEAIVCAHGIENSVMDSITNKIRIQLDWRRW